MKQIGVFFAFFVCAVATAACVQRATPVRADADIIIHNVTVVDVVNGALRPGLSVGITNDRITFVRPARTVRPATGTKVIDGDGRYVIPGLWDMHTHALWSADAVATFLPAYVASGVTGIRDMGGDLDLVRAARASALSGGAIVPRIHGAGPVLDGPSPVDPDISIAVADSARGRVVVDSLAAAGVDFIKVYTLLARDAYMGIIAGARLRNLTVAGHLPFEITAVEAARLGQTSIEHLNDEIEPFCTPSTASQCNAAIDAFRTHQTWQVPTLVALRMKALVADTGYVTDSRLQYIPRTLRASWLKERDGKIKRGAAYLDGKKVRYSGELWLTNQLWTQQVPMLAGSDAGVAFSFPGFSLHDELALLVDAGLSNTAALQAATIGPARFLHATDSMGTIAAGKLADLVLLRGNPLLDIRNTRAIDVVVLRGRVLDRAALDALLDGVARAAER